MFMKMNVSTLIMEECDFFFSLMRFYLYVLMVMRDLQTLVFVDASLVLDISWVIELFTWLCMIA